MTTTTNARCERVRRIALPSGQKFVRCNKEAGDHHHFGTWGGSQRWNQTQWATGDPGDMALADVPRGKRVW